MEQKRFHVGDRVRLDEGRSLIPEVWGCIGTVTASDGDGYSMVELDAPVKTAHRTATGWSVSNQYLEHYVDVPLDTLDGIEAYLAPTQIDPETYLQEGARNAST